MGGWLRGGCLLVAVACVARLGSVTLEELRSDPKMTPQKFSSYFSKFRYEFHEEIQEPAMFLLTEAGDCDDYATLADSILREKGYNTRLVAVRMPGLSHVVCYVTETKSYLDFNNRDFLIRTIKCRPDLPEIAKKVAQSFDSSWTSASEFVYTNGVKILVSTIVKTAIQK